MAPTTPQQAGALSDKAILADALETFGRCREYSNCFAEATEGQLLRFVRKYIDHATAATDSAARAETGPVPSPGRVRKAMGASFQAAAAAPTPEPAATDSEEDAHVIKRLSGILADVALALMGDELPDDRAEILEKLPKVAQVLKFELELYRSGVTDTPAPSNLVDAADGQGDLQEQALLAAGRWATADTPIKEALAYRDGFVAGGASSQPAAADIDPRHVGDSAWKSIPILPPVEAMDYYGEQFSAPVLLRNGAKILDHVARWSFVEDGWVGSHFSGGPSPADYEWLNEAPVRWMLLADAALTSQAVPAAQATAARTDDDVFAMVAEVLGNPLIEEYLKGGFVVYVQSGDWLNFARTLLAAQPVSVDAVPVAYWWMDMEGHSIKKAIGFEAPSRIPTSALHPLFDAAPPASTSADAQAPAATKGMIGCAECTDEPECAWYQCCIRKVYEAADAQAPVDFPYQRTFNAIAAATEIAGGNISISVRKFQEAYNAAPTQPTKDKK